MFATKMRGEVTHHVYYICYLLNNLLEDLKAAKQYAQSLLNALVAYSRTVLSPSPKSSASSSVAPPPPETEEELEKARIETMKLLTEVLQRNIRVRFDLNMDELFKA